MNEGNPMMSLEDVHKILRQNPEFARIDDLITPYYELMKVVITAPGIKADDRAKIIALIEKLTLKLK